MCEIHEKSFDDSKATDDRSGDLSQPDIWPTQYSSQEICGNHGIVNNHVVMNLCPMYTVCNHD